MKITVIDLEQPNRSSNKIRVSNLLNVCQLVEIDCFVADDSFRTNSYNVAVPSRGSKEAELYLK
jgi:hypothetical protein